MALDMLVDSSQLDADLEDIADAIRAKTGGSSTLAFPSDFLTEIAGISGGSSWTKLAETTLSVSTSSTSAASAGTLACGTAAYTAGSIVYVRIRDTAGKRAGYFYGSDAFFLNYQAANGSTSTLTYALRCSIYYNSSSAFGLYPTATTGGYGVYGYSISSSGTLTVRKRYNSSYSLTIDGDYKVEVYVLTTPDSVSPFA